MSCLYYSTLGDRTNPATKPRSGVRGRGIGTEPREFEARLAVWSLQLRSCLDTTRDHTHRLILSAANVDSLLNNYSSNHCVSLPTVGFHAKRTILASWNVRGYYA